MLLDLWLLQFMPENSTTKSEALVPQQDVYDAYMS